VALAKLNRKSKFCFIYYLFVLQEKSVLVILRERETEVIEWKFLYRQNWQRSSEWGIQADAESTEAYWTCTSNHTKFLNVAFIMVFRIKKEQHKWKGQKSTPPIIRNSNLKKKIWQSTLLMLLKRLNPSNLSVSLQDFQVLISFH